jgi:hypothetical protein
MILTGSLLRWRRCFSIAFSEATGQRGFRDRFARLDVPVQDQLLDPFVGLLPGLGALSFRSLSGHAGYPATNSVYAW